MSAIEVLKEMLLIFPDKTIDGKRNDKFVALNEALLALEQKEKLKEWFEKEIENCIEEQKYYADAGDDETGLIWTSRVETLKEVLGLMK